MFNFIFGIIVGLAVMYYGIVTSEQLKKVDDKVKSFINIDKNSSKGK